MSFERRKLSVEVYVGANTAQAAQQVIKINGYRMVANIVTNGGMATGQAQMQVFGLPLSMINQLTAIPNSGESAKNQWRNTAVILAQSGDNTPEIVFAGTILMAWGAFESAPDTGFMMQLHSTYPMNVLAHAPTSVKGSVNASALVQQLSRDAGWSFQNHGVQIPLKDPYHTGSVMQQMRQIQKAGAFNLDVDRGVVHTWPSNGHRKGPIPEIGPGERLVGYPRVGGYFMSLRAEFLPEAVLGGHIRVQGSQLSAANGLWYIQSATHSLSSEMPGGPWFTDIEVRRPTVTA